MNAIYTLVPFRLGPVGKTFSFFNRRRSAKTERKNRNRREMEHFSWGLVRRALSIYTAERERAMSPPAPSSASVYVSDPINLIGIIHIYTRREGWGRKGTAGASLSDADDRGLLLFLQINGE